MTGLAAALGGQVQRAPSPTPARMLCQVSTLTESTLSAVSGSLALSVDNLKFGKFIARWQLTLPVSVGRSQAALMVALERPATVTGTPTQVSLRSGQILGVLVDIMI